MPKLRNRTTGVVVSTSAEVAKRLAAFEWEPADKPKRAASSSDK